VTNTFKYQTVWTKEYQKSNWAMPVYPVIADLQFTPQLSIGDTVKRRYRNNPIFSNDLSSDGSYSPQNYSEGEESFTISKQKEASVRIVKPEVLHTDLPVTQSYGKQLSNAIYNTIDGDVLNAARAGAGTTISDGDLGGTSGNGITLSIANIAELPLMAIEKFRGSNVIYDLNKRFGKLAYEDYDGLMTWIMPPQVATWIDRYLMARGTALGDQVTVNGYKGIFGSFSCFINNNLPFTARLALGANPTDGDTFTFKGVTFRYKDTLAANGDIKIGATAADTADNTVTALNALTTNVSLVYDALVDGTDTVSEGGFTIDKSRALQGISATDGTTYVDILMKGTGKVTVSNSFASALNGFSTATTLPLQIVHSLFIIGKNVSLAVRQDPEIYENPVSGKVARDYVMWTVYDMKVFRDQARAIIDLLIACSSSAFATFTNVHA
jgi:hypothetical protein